MPSQLILRFQYQRIQKLRLRHLLAGTQIEIISMEQRWRGQLHEEGELDLSTLTDEAWRAYFQFTQAEVIKLVQVLNLPNPVYSSNRTREDPQIALCMLLNRLAYPNRYADQALKFGW
ncbi:hypothetical protein BDZ91DRAFT_98995 [Kalaharituber pfeilii]|nr:hypothetical protein BDZ91DRAFT_98995 [Kalaharituber pfeilii]